MLLPVVNSAASLMNPNSWLAHRMISSERREKCIIHSAAAAINSARKSRSETASMLLALTAAKPSSRARNSRSVGYGTPARAPLPNGSTSARRRPSASRPMSRCSISK